MSQPITAPTSASSLTIWTRHAVLAIGLCFAINMVDGMDVVIMSYIAPALAKDWGVPPEALGIVFSAGLLGMAIGGIFIAPLADKYGRRFGFDNWHASGCADLRRHGDRDRPRCYGSARI
jgi:MFS family permease